MKIYTKTGDQGQTSLATGERISKTDLRIEAYGTSDELNSFVGNLRAVVTDNKIDNELTFIQNRLFDIGATLAGAPIPLPNDAATCLEQWMDTMQATLPTTHAFILPAGGEAASRCHICRTITRRLERCCLRIDNAQNIYPKELVFLNRLSDYFFVLARYIGQQEGFEPTFWQK